MAGPEIREEMKEIAGRSRRFGYRRIGILLERKGMLMKLKQGVRTFFVGRPVPPKVTVT